MKQSNEMRKGVLLIERILDSHQFEDYFQLYILVRKGVQIDAMIEGVVKRTGNVLSKRSLYAILTNGNAYTFSESSSKASYDVSPYDIQEYIKLKLLEKKA